MKTSKLFSAILFFSLPLIFSLVNAQTPGVAISDSSGKISDASAMLDISVTGSTKKGILIPRMTLTERGTISSPKAGLLIFQTDNTSGFYYFDGTSWSRISNSGFSIPYSNYTTSSGDAFSITNNGSGTGVYGFGYNGNGVYGQSTSGRGVYGYSYGGVGGSFTTNSGYSLIATGGNAGIGTLTPTEKLEVSGNIKSSGTVTASGFFGDGSGLTNLSGSLSLPFSASPSTSSNAFEINNSGGTAFWGQGNSGGYGLYARYNNAGNYGYVGGSNYGVFGSDGSGTAYGYLGGSRGVFGHSNGDRGVYGESTLNTGVYGMTNTVGSNAYGVFGYNGVNYGYLGGQNYGVYSSGQAGGTTGWSSTSDIRFKKNISALVNSLQKVLTLRGVSFDWKTDEFSERNFKSSNQIGFIAQEVKDILPEVVNIDSEGYYSVEYDKVVPVMVEAIKEQQKTIESQKGELNSLQKRISELEKRINKIQTNVGSAPIPDSENQNKSVSN
ncbi:MAG: tail fiber domain-containing protein [Bacteroidetes bacterium]|nr:tail fiber domain-containing protein [Bacteroidota bacterium]